MSAFSMNGVCHKISTGDRVSLSDLASGPVMASSKVFMKYFVPSKTFRGGILCDALSTSSFQHLGSAGMCWGWSYFARCRSLNLLANLGPSPYKRCGAAVYHSRSRVSVRALPLSARRPRDTWAYHHHLVRASSMRGFFSGDSSSESREVDGRLLPRLRLRHARRRRRRCRRRRRRARRARAALVRCRRSRRGRALTAAAAARVARSRGRERGRRRLRSRDVGAPWPHTSTPWRRACLLSCRSAVGHLCSV